VTPAPGIGDIGSSRGRQVAGGAKFEEKKFMNKNAIIKTFFADSIFMKAFEGHYTDVK